MSAQDLLQRLDDLGVGLTLADDRIRYRGKGEALPPELLAEMKRHRDELVDLLGRRERLAWPPARAAVPGDRRGPLTKAQQTLWATDYFAEDGTYNLCGALRLRGPLDEAAFRAALADLHERHPSLRTVFPVEQGEPRQHVLSEVEPPLEVVAASGLDDCLAECARLADRRLALDTAPPVAMRLFRLAADDHVFFFVLHHVIADGGSFGPLIDDLARCYRGRLPGGEPAGVASDLDMIDYARWEADRLAYADLAPARKYWRERLDGAALGALPLPPPLDGPPTDHRGGAHQAIADAPTTGAVRLLAESARASTFLVVSAAISAALSRYTGRDDLVVGMPVSRRDRTGLDRMVGLLLDMAPVRLDLGGGPTFTELVRRTRTAVLGAVGNVPAPVESTGGDRLFNVILTDLGAELPPPDFPGLTAEHVEVPQVGAKYDLNFLVRDGGDTLAIDVEFDRRAIGGSDVAALTAMALEILREAATDAAARVADLAATTFGVAAPGAIGVEPDRTPRADESLTGRLAEVARTRADAAAVTSGDDSVSYRELVERVERTAGGLRGLGVREGDVVAISLPRGFDLVVAILGVMASGAACLVLDDSWPDARVAGVLADSRAKLTITADSEHMTLARLAEVDAAPLEPVPAHAAAYVIYTSGSTGRPKGVRVTHRNVLSLLDATGGGYYFGPDDVWSLFHACSFDVSMYEMFGCLLNGGRLVVVPKWTTREPDAFARLLRRERVTVLSQTPSALSVMLPAIAKEPEAAEHIRYVLFAGEALDRALVDRWYAVLGDRTRLVNMYGITETTVHASWRWLRPDDVNTAESDVGVPLPGTALHVLHDNGTPVANRCVGEIYVGGPQVSDGYLGRPRETALRFLPDPFSGVPGARMYRSGDLARRDGTSLSYLGRRDRQVQVNGFRVELAEIEEALAATPGVTAAAAAVTEDDSGAHIVAVVVVDGTAPSIAELAAAARSVLPRYMVPSALAVVDELPLTTNGKLDRSAVVAAASASELPAAPAVPPKGAAQTILLEVFREVLADGAVTTGTDFFHHGGDSMRAIRLVGLAKDRGLRLTVRDVYAAPMVTELAELAEFVDPRDATRNEPFALLPADQRGSFADDVVDAYPMTAMQSGMIYHQELAPGARVYHIMLSYRVRGTMDPVAFRAAAQAVTDAHPVLRTSFDLANANGPVQRVHTGIQVPIEFEDITRLAPADQDARIRQVVERETASDFDLDRPPLLRLVVLTTSAEDYQLVFTHHHAILDGWSVNVFFEDLHAQYLARLADGAAAGPLERPRTTFADYVALERHALEDPEHERFWAARTSSPARLIAPDRSGAPVMRQFHVDFAGVVDELRSAAARVGVSPKALLCASHLRVVSWLTGHDDVATSLVFAARPEASDSERILGLFLNQLPLRLTIAGQSWAELAREAHQEEQAMMRHRWYPNAAIQARHGGLPLFDSSFNFTDYHTTRRLVLDGSLELLDSDELESTHYAFGSNFTVDVRNHELRLLMEYDEAALPHSTLVLAAEVHRRAVAAIVADPDALVRDTTLPGIADLARLMEAERIPSAPTGPARPASSGLVGRTVPTTAEPEPVSRPASAIEDSVREVWAEVLGTADFDATTNFFEAGGDSLTAMQVLSRLRARHGRLSMVTFMESPTIAGVARALDAGTAATPAKSEAPVKTTVDGPRRYPLSRAQQQMWQISNQLPGIGLFGMLGALRADGPLDIALLERTFAVLIRRHEALRTRVESTDVGPVQVVEPHAELAVESVDLSAEPDPTTRCERLMAASGRESVALDQAPLLRVIVYRLGADRHVIFLNIHHIVCDGWSLTLLLQDASRTYRELAEDGEPADRPIPLGSGWLAESRSNWLESEEARSQQAYWLDQLAPPWPALADGPNSRFAELKQASFVQRLRSASCRSRISADDVLVVREAAHKHGMTEFMLVLGAFAATLRSWSGQDDIRIATMLANRVQPGMEDVVGLVANTGVLRMRFAGTGTDPVAVSRQAREVCVGAFENQELLFEDLLEGIKERHPDGEGTGPVYEAMLIAQEETARVEPDEGLTFAPYQSERDVLGAQIVATSSDFILGVAPIDGELLFELRYKPATTPKEMAVELIEAVTAAVRTTARALRESP